MSSQDVLREWALYCAAMGWHVFPLVSASKRPAVRGWEARATIDRDRIARCWGSGAFNIGLATGPSRLLVVDCDTAKQPGEVDGATALTRLADERGVELPATYTVATPSGGRHLYFTLPPGVRLRNTAGQLAPRIDTRSGGGYVVAPGSVLAEGGYELADDTDPAPLPGWLLQVLCERPAPATSSAGVGPVARPSAYAASALRGECDEVRSAPPGRHNEVLSRAAYRVGRLVGGGLLDAEHARAELTHAAHALVSAECGCTPAEVTRVIAAGLAKGRTQPRSLPSRSDAEVAA
ncbi:bifunctional DNA primase/polymerase [Saccharomonospora glauca]|uniref:Bifunctional DNA primase/polymerase famiily protein n=1 Tax=Saccharomonospora glauca K62 TaxID=928724 RepID=I1D4C2_9PSEU|nr:bifunctional DNA primase/polymerase [Saccharomonospora glauca]EIE99796.1 bifunctional DNA primase/polymerase famiily protein [Saccharomonospora glauca K62]